MSILTGKSQPDKAGPIDVRTQGPHDPPDQAPKVGPFSGTVEMIRHARHNPVVRRRPLVESLIYELADRGGSKGVCWGSVRNLASRLLTSRTAIRRAVAKALELGYIVSATIRSDGDGYDFVLPITPGLSKARKAAPQGHPPWSMVDHPPWSTRRCPPGSWEGGPPGSWWTPNSCKP